MLLLPDMEPSSAAEFADDVRRAVQGLAIAHAANATHGALVTVSIGCCTAMPGAHLSDQDVVESLQVLVSSCDRALYGAKHAGRNCVVVGAGLREQMKDDLPTLAV